MPIYFSQLTEICHAKILKTGNIDQEVAFLITDSRKIVSASRSVFFAIKGERHDGHAFLEEVYEAGIRHFIVEKTAIVGIKDVIIRKLLEADVLIVDNCIHALQELAAHQRKQFDIPVIGITGSNGKTIVKEWLSQMLSPEFVVVKNPRSYNSQLGVPLSIWQMSELHTMGVFEAGISKPEEMEYLQKVIQPTLGIFTNIGSAHDEGFESREQKIKEKLKLFEHTSLIFYSKNHSEIDQIITQENKKTVTWSYKSDGDFLVKVLQISQSSVSITISKTNDSKWITHTYLLPFNDYASIENLIHCIVVLLHFDYSHELIQRKVSALKPVSMRLELKEGINGCYLIDDSYNNDLAGLTIALDFLKQQNQKLQKTLILSDLFETGLAMNTLYRVIADRKSVV